MFVADSRIEMQNWIEQLQKVVSMFEAETFTARYFVRELSGFILQKPLFEVRVILMTFI